MRHVGPFFAATILHMTKSLNGRVFPVPTILANRKKDPHLTSWWFASAATLRLDKTTGVRANAASDDCEHRQRPLRSSRDLDLTAFWVAESGGMIELGIWMTVVLRRAADLPT
jgi:hypothetical protein